MEDDEPPGVPPPVLQRMVPWRAILVAFACAFIGLMAYMAVIVSRSMVGRYAAHAPQEAARVRAGDTERLGAARVEEGAAAPGSAGAAEDDGAGVDYLPEVDPVLFRNRLDAVSGGTLPVWDPEANATLVDFWASWCRPCLDELPHLQALHEKVAARGYRIVLINVDLPDRDRTGRFLERKGVHLDSLVDRDAVLFQALGLEALPSAFVLDRKGRPVRFIEGGISAVELESALLRANEKHVRRTFQ